MAKAKKPPATPTDAEIIADVWHRHFRFEVVPADVLIAYNGACSRLGDPAEVERIKGAARERIAAERAEAEANG